MKMQEYVDEIALKLTGGVVDLEIQNVLEKIINAAFREIKRYINIQKVITIPYSQCIDLLQYKVATPIIVTRTGYGYSYDTVDAFYLAMNMVASGGSFFDLSGYLSWQTLKQIKNTISTDMDFIWTKPKLYLNATYPYPPQVSILYVPEFTDISEIDDDYWCDILVRLSLALAKETLGRSRGKFVLNNAVYTTDASQLLSEAQAELTEIRQHLQENSDLSLPLD